MGPHKSRYPVALDHSSSFSLIISFRQFLSLTNLAVAIVRFTDSVHQSFLSFPVFRRTSLGQQRSQGAGCRRREGNHPHQTTQRRGSNQIGVSIVSAVGLVTCLPYFVLGGTKHNVTPKKLSSMMIEALWRIHNWIPVSVITSSLIENRNKTFASLSLSVCSIYSATLPGMTAYLHCSALILFCHAG